MSSPASTCNYQDSDVPTTIHSAPTPSNEVLKTKSDEDRHFADVVFNATTYTVICHILFIMITYTLFKAIFANRGLSVEGTPKMGYSRTIDLVLCFLLYSTIFYHYYHLDDNQKKNILGTIIQWTENYFDNSWALFELIWFSIFFFLFVYILGVPMEKDVKPVLVHFLEQKIWLVFLAFGIVYFFKYVLEIPILTLLFDNSLMNYFKNVEPYTKDGNAPSVFDALEQDLYKTNNDAEKEQKEQEEKEEKKEAEEKTCDGKQVFNLGNNLYTYEEAQKACQAFDAPLATYEQIENSYHNGGEWCNYGWSEGQMAFFPTQKDTFDELQKNPRTKNVCGRPGINGGYIGNPYVRFGANCYGVKPEKPDGWKETSYVQDYVEEVGENVQEEEEDPSEKLRSQAQLNNFNNKKWSRY